MNSYINAAEPCVLCYYTSRIHANNVIEYRTIITLAARFMII